LGVAGGQILGFSIDLLRRPYNTLALPCECVIQVWTPYFKKDIDVLEKLKRRATCIKKL